MPDRTARHLVLELHDRATAATIACMPDRVRYDRAEHTLLAAMATCSACRAVQAARVALIDADPQWA